VPPRRKPAPALVWEQPEPARRPAPGPLSRERIVRAALAIADKRGLAEVSLRKVAAKLKAGPMRLYGYTSTKDGLLELMVDAVYGEIVEAGPLSGDVRAVLRSIAQRTRAAAMTHRWFVDLIGGRRPHFGPNALAHFEASLAALGADPAFADVDAALQALAIVNAYVIGALRGETSELLAERERGMTEREWQDASWPYLQRMIATGRYPTVAKVVREATHPPSEVVFEHGLDCVIDGILSRLGRGSSSTSRTS
jgi:AcrR family transcriptional regulator